MTKTDSTSTKPDLRSSVREVMRIKALILKQFHDRQSGQGSDYFAYVDVTLDIDLVESAIELLNEELRPSWRIFCPAGEFRRLRQLIISPCVTTNS